MPYISFCGLILAVDKITILKKGMDNMALLKAEHTTKKYSGRTIIKDINIELHRGELVSLLGVSGSGKTTLFHVLSGLTTPEEGRVFLNGEDITSKPGQISYMLQKDLLFPHKKIIDNTALPLVLHGMSKKEAREKAQTYFKDFGLEGTEYQYPSQLSGGMRQRAALLRTYLSSCLLYTSRWLENGKTLSMKDIEKISWRYAREVEHSDNNLNTLEDWLFENYYLIH